MTEILLIIALVLAIFMDAIRIMQYVQMRKSINKNAMDAFYGKIDRMYLEWSRDENSELTFTEYIRKYWEDAD